MKTQNRALLLLGGLLLALLLAFAVAPLSDAHVLAAPAVAQGSVSASNLPVATCTLASTTRTCELWAVTGTLALPTGASVPVWGFTDVAASPAQVPGPAIVANAGETLEIIFHNDLLTETVSLTFPGQMGLVPDLEGVPAGATTTYSFTLGAPGTYLYEAGMTPNGARQVTMGLHGALVVRPAGAPSQAYDNPATAFQDEALVVLGAIDPLFNADPNNYDVQFFSPQYWLINGLAYPDTVEIGTVAGNTLLLRYINATERTQGMGALGLRQLVIGNDGYPVEPPYGVVAETIAAGQSMDMLVSVPLSTTTGTKFALYNAALMNHNASDRAASGNLAFGGMMTFINTVTGEPTWVPGPLTKNVHVGPSPTVGTGGVTLTADIFASAGLNVVAAEYFTDTLGAFGTGIPIPVTQGAQASVSVVIPAAELATWPGGYPIFYVRGQDDAGTWGVPGAAVLNLDKVGPDVTSLNLSRDPTNGTLPVTLRGTANDWWSGHGNIVSATYVIDGMQPATMTLNRADWPIVEISAIISTSVLSPLLEANYPITVTAQDALANWGPPSVITLTLDKTGPTAPVVTLTPDYLDLTQPLTVTRVRLDAALADAVSGGVQSSVANARAFVDVISPSLGFALFPNDGLFDEPEEDAYFDMPLAHFMMLPHGTHTVTVQAMDVAGNWGAYGEAFIFVDRGGEVPGDFTGPAITTFAAAPNPTDGAATVTLTANASDPGSESNIAEGEWFVGADPGPGNGFALSATDGAFDSPVEGLTGVIDVSAWGNGNYQISVRALDASNNWGPPAGLVLRVSGNNAVLILLDNFDTGTLDAWTAVVGQVTATIDASLPAGSHGYGMAAILGPDPAYVSHLMPPGERSYYASFYYDPNLAAMGDAHHDIFMGLDHGTPIFGIQVEESGDSPGQYEIRGWALASGVPAYTTWYDISSGSRLGIQWRSSPDGMFALLIDDAVVEELGNLDASGHLLYEARLGPSSNLDALHSGAEYFDVFQAGRTLFTYLPAIWRMQ